MQKFYNTPVFAYRLLAAFGLLVVSVFAQAQASLPLSRTAWLTSAPPTGWTQNTVVNRTTTFACSGSDGGSLQAAGAYYQVQFSAAPGTLTYAIKSSAMVGSFKVQESANSTAWTDLIVYTSATGITTCKTETFSLLSASRYVRFFYETRTSGNVDIDDVTIGLPLVACTTPSAVTGETVAPTSATAISGSFTTNSSTAYMVVQTTTGVLSAMPTDGTSYAVNAALGGGTVVSNGSTGTFSKTGLTACTQYYYHIFAYNSTTCSGGPKYSPETITTTGTTCSLTEIISFGGEPATVSSLKTGTIAAVTDGAEVWQIQIRDGNSTIDADFLPTIMTGLTITKNASSSAAFDAIQDAVLVDVATNTILAHATITTTLAFTGFSVTCADDATKTLALRITLKCPLPVSSLDGSRFVFNITNANMTTAGAATSSQKMAFTAVNSLTAGKNVIDVVATQLTFLSQPSDTPTNEAMLPSVTVRATDACGNVDLNGALTIALNSTGTPTAQPSAITVNGVATFANIVHTAAGTGFALTATNGVLTATSNLFNIQTPTILHIGDLAMIGYDTYKGSGGNDKIVLTNLVDLAAGTTFTVANAVYEIGAMAYERTDRWYSGNGGASGASGGGQNVAYIKFRTLAPVAKGATICINNLAQLATMPNPATDFTVNGIANTTWKTSGTGFVNVNSGGRGDAIWLMQGSFTPSPTLDPNSLNYSTFTGNLLNAVQFNSYACVTNSFYQFEEDVPVLSCAFATETNRVSRIHPDLECIAVGFSPAEAFYMEYDAVAPHNNTQHSLLGSIANFSGNWSSASNTTETDLGDDLSLLCSAPAPFTVTQPLVHGRWLGNTGGTFGDRDWFFCGNWDDFQVPNETNDVVIPALATDGVDANDAAEIDILQSTYAVKFNNLAQAKNLTINSPTAPVRAELGSNVSVLEVHGNLTIANGAALDLSTSATEGGLLKLWGNWTNNNTTDKVTEAGSLVQFMGVNTQTLSNTSGTEMLHNVIIQKDPETLLDLNAHFAMKNLSFGSGGIIRTNASRVHVLHTDPISLSGYFGSGFNDAYIQGKLRRNVLGATLYDFPVGDNTHFTQIAQLDFTTGVGSYAEINYTNAGSGVYSQNIPCDVDADGDTDLVKYDKITGTWNINSDAVNGGFDCAVTLQPDGTLNPFTAGVNDNMRHSGALILGCGDPGFAESGNTTQTVSDFSPFQMVSGVVVLPVKLLSLSAKVVSKAVLVEWVTASEQNNKQFDIERSTDGITFYKIGEVRGNGTTNTTHKYAFLDEKAQNGTNYYRLRQADFDGKTTASQIVSAVLAQTQNVAINGNPIHNNLDIFVTTDATENANLEIFSMDGKSVYTQNLNLESGVNTHRINTTYWVAGVYVLRFKNGAFAHTERFVKQ